MRAAAAVLALALALALALSPAHAQVVSTLPAVPGLATPDGFAVAKNGDLYIAGYGQGAGTRVYRLKPNGTSDVFAEGFNGPDGLTFDTAGDLYVSNFSSGVINRVSPAGKVSVFATGLDHPAGLVWHRGALYVANFGNFNGTTVSRVTRDGAVSTFASGFTTPLGIAVGADSAVYVSSYGSGEIHRVAANGSATVFATIPNTPLANLQFIAVDRDGTLLVPSYGHGRVYAIDRSGAVTIAAGSGIAGDTDGAAADARFHGPNGIALMPDGSLVVSEYASARLRRIANVRTAGRPAYWWPAVATPSVDAARLASDTATFVVRTGATRDSIGVVHMRRAISGQTLTIAREWRTGGQARTDSASTLQRPDGSFDTAVLPDVVAALATVDGVLPIHSAQQRGVTPGAVSTTGVTPTTTTASVAYPSSMMTVVFTRDGRRILSTTYDYGGGRIITLNRR